MKCRVCREPAVIDVRRHNAGFCRDHFLVHCREQVRRAIDDCRRQRAIEGDLTVTGAAKEMHPVVRDEIYRPTLVWPRHCRRRIPARDSDVPLATSEHGEPSSRYTR